MRGRFIAADARYQSQSILDKNTLLEILFPTCGKSFHPHSTLNSPDSALQQDWKNNLTHLSASLTDVNFQYRHSDGASTRTWQPWTLHRKMHSLCVSVMKTNHWEAKPKATDSSGRIPNDSKGIWSKEFKGFASLYIHLHNTVLNHHIYISYTYIWIIHLYNCCACISESMPAALG